MKVFGGCLRALRVLAESLVIYSLGVVALSSFFGFSVTGVVANITPYLLVLTGIMTAVDVVAIGMLGLIGLVIGYVKKAQN